MKIEQIAGRDVVQTGPDILPTGWTGWVVLCPSEDRIAATFAADEYDAAKAAAIEEGQRCGRMVALCADYGSDTPMLVNFTY